MNSAVIAWADRCRLRRALNSDPNKILISRAFDLTNPHARYRLFEDDKGIAGIVVHFSDYYQIGIWLRPELRGGGHAQCWFQKSIAELPKGHLFAVIEKTNAASLALFSACGFRQLSSQEPKNAMITLSLKVAES